MYDQRRHAWRLGVAALLASGFLAGARVPASAARAHAVPAASAPSGPGALASFDVSRKNCLGTARNTTSKVWFTVAQGILSDVYYPTNDNTNVKTLQYAVTDGSTFTDLQTRDMTYTVRALDPRALDCEVTSTAKSGKYKITTDYLTDPGRDTVVMHTTFTALAGARADYTLYLRYDPTINGNGGGGSGNGGGDSGAVASANGHDVLVASDTVTATNAPNRTYATPIYSALDASTPFAQVTNGFAGTPSDPLTALDASHTLGATHDTATDGNLVQGAQIQLSPVGGSATSGVVTLALGFGATQGDAVGAAQGSLSASFDALRAAYEEGWHAYDSALNAPPASFPGVSSAAENAALSDEYYLNANLLKLAEDKTFPGALSAGPTLPWGQAVSAGDPTNTYDGGYREVFARDLYEEWTGLYTDGDYATAADAVNFLFLRQQRPDGSMPRNSLPNGQPAPDTFNTQLDECAYPILMADQLGGVNAAYRDEFVANGDFYRRHIKPAADFVISHGPSYGPERWEEQSGYSPSTIAAEVAGLVAAADIADANGDTASAALYRGVADDYQRSVEGETVTTNGPLASHPYFIRLSKTGDPNTAISYGLNNGGPTLDQRAVIDAGFLELVRLGLKPADEITVTESLPVVDATIMSDTVAGPGWHRYNGDGYGDAAATGHPWAPTGVGTGHVWPVLTGERAEYDLAAGDAVTATALLDTMRRFGIGNAPNPYDSGVGLIPEQDWDLPDLAPSPNATDPTTASIGFANGQPAGSSDPLNWADGQFVRLTQDIKANAVLERPAATYDRYVTHQQGQTSLTLASPADNSTVSGASVTVSGATAAGNTVYVAGVNIDNGGATATISATAGGDGRFSVAVPITGGTTALNVVAVSPGGATAHAERSVASYFTPGTVLLDAADPDGDDNGPGNYAYPTASAFQPGAYDIEEFQVIDAGDSVVFRLKTRDLTPTFGSPLGAQLVDVYVHDPSAAPGDTSTAAAYASRNYTIAPDAAWSRRIEAQGFGSQYVDAHGATLGTVAIGANQILRLITFSVPKASLGPVGPGWGFTVVLAGQDGYSPDLARAFTLTPGGYSFGVCASDNPGLTTDPHCTVNGTNDPTKVPKAMDVLTPPGVSQADELDYTKHSPVALQDVVIPSSGGPGGAPTPELGSGELLLTALLPLGLALALKRRRSRRRAPTPGQP